MKKKLCFVPYESFETYALEQWLDEQATKGYRLERFVGAFAVFCKSAPSQTRYRLDTLSSEKYHLEEEIHEEAAKQGWTYLCDFAWHAYSVYSSDHPDAVELHSDSQVLRSVMKGRLAANLAALVILLAYLLVQAFQSNGLIAVIRNSGGSMLYTNLIVYQLAALILLLVFWLLFALISADSIFRAYRDLSVGHAVIRRRPWVRPAVYTVLMILALAIAVLVFGFGREGNRELFSMEEWDEPFPVQTWGEFAPEEYQGCCDYEFVFESRSPFAHRIIMFRQKGVQDDVGLYYDVDICQMKTLSFSQKLFDAFVREYGAELLPGKSDMAYVHNDFFQTLILQSGNTVIRIGYNGAQNLRTVRTDL